MAKLKRYVSLARDFAGIAAILLAGAWSIWLFIYQDRILPAKIHLHIVAYSALEVIGSNKDAIAVRARVRVLNNSNVQARILGAWFNLRAYSIAPATTKLASDTHVRQIQNQEGGEGREFVDLPRKLEPTVGEIINSGRLLQPVWWLEPTEEHNIEFVTFVPKKYDLVSLRCTFRVIRGPEVPNKLIQEWSIGQDGAVALSLSMC